MNYFKEVHFFALDGDHPSSVHLDILPDSCIIEKQIKEAFTPYSGRNQSLNPNDDMAGLLLLYVYGHAWLTDSKPQVSIRDGSSNQVLEANAFIERVLSVGVATQSLLILDVCHAAAFRNTINRIEKKPRMVVYGSGIDEKALSFPRDGGSRLSLAIAQELGKREEPFDFAVMIDNISRKLGQDGVLQGQEISYELNGSAIFLGNPYGRKKYKRIRTVAFIRNVLIAFGAIMATLTIGIVWFYWGHTWVEINIGNLPKIAENIHIVVTKEYPSENKSTLYLLRRITNSRFRKWIPSTNIILRVSAEYIDGSERVLNHHLLLEPGLSFNEKWLRIDLPPAKDILSKPGMAYIPPSTWYKGRDLEKQQSLVGYWIDIRPPTVDEYLPIGRINLEEDRLGPMGSFLLNTVERTSAVEVFGLKQLDQLSNDLSKIFAILEEGEGTHTSAPGDLAVGLNELPSGDCPAPMYRKEAEAYCKCQGKRLPADWEWELASRGVDGRTYPWGDRIDKQKANIEGLPDEVGVVSKLKPIHAYTAFPSPFGLIDTVGNAGDWVINTTGSYENVYMGATYQWNPEDAVTYQMLPVTSDSMIREITVRCVKD